MKPFVLLLTLALLAIPSAAGNAGKQQDDDARPVSFRGTWQTIGNGVQPITVILKQVGKEVTGSYSSGNGKIFDGEVSDNKLTFKWSQDGGYEGIAEFTMDRDGKGFTGSSTALKPEQYTVTWNSYVSSFGGSWQTISDGKNSTFLTMVQNGSKVTGIYPDQNGKLEGTVSGKVLRFKWESENGSGSGRFVMDEGSSGFSGTYNRGDNPDEVEATWNGTHPSGKGGKIRPAVSVAGVWNAETSTGYFQLILRQDGNQVTGTIKLPGDDGISYLDEVTLVGNTLRFKFALKKKNDASGQFVFVMNEGGKFLNGKIWEQSISFIFSNPL